MGLSIAASMANDQIGMLADGVVQSQKNFKDPNVFFEGRAVTAGTEIPGLADIIRRFGSATLDAGCTTPVPSIH